MSMGTRTTHFLMLAGCVLAASACGNQANFGGSGPQGSLRLGLSIASAHDVASVHYVIRSGGTDCSTGEVVMQGDGAIEDEVLPPGARPPGAGDNHRFADFLCSLAPGDYRICATPLQTDGTPSDDCAATDRTAAVVAGATNEVVLISQCVGDDSGALGAITMLNDPPRVDSIAIDPSRFIVTCQPATIAITASDRNGETLSYAWAIVSGPGDGTLVPSGASATFTSWMTGDYTLRVTVTDGLGGSTTLTFPIHVSPQCDDAGACDAGPTCGPPLIGCSDGEREGFVDAALYPNIAGCSGGWEVPGIHTTIGPALACPGLPTFNTLAPACGRVSGDDSANPTGDDCDVEDLCAAGWHVCTSAADVAAHSATGCNGAALDTQPLFFATRQTSNGCGVCATGTSTGPECNSVSCAPGCAQTAAVSNDVFGCGNFGSTAVSDCGELQRFSHNECIALPGGVWRCDAPDGLCEAFTITKAGPTQGGVICCRD